MHCQHCGLINGEDDHRCLRCGRRIAGVVIAAPQSYIGATALAMQASPETDRDMSPELRERPILPQQPPLFGAPQTTSHNVIPFEQLQRQVAGRFAQPLAAPSSRISAQKPAQPEGSPRTLAKKVATSGVGTTSNPASGQGNFDFRPDVPQGERILATGVPAQVYGDGHVAPPARRITAGAMDVSMVLIGFGVFVAAAKVAGVYIAASAGQVDAESSGFGSGKALWITLSLSLILISLFYGLLWALARRETAGMNWTQLHLVTFDGSALDGRDRAIRFVSAWLSYCSGGLGLLWALADEESLAFHDHISKTYPAEKGSSRPFVRQRR
jgi:uncharacterized RDD family membrane protein YckC